jgi:hypothetical protein
MFLLRGLDVSKFQLPAMYWNKSFVKIGGLAYFDQALEPKLSR